MVRICRLARLISMTLILVEAAGCKRDTVTPPLRTRPHFIVTEVDVAVSGKPIVSVEHPDLAELYDGILNVGEVALIDLNSIYSLAAPVDLYVGKTNWRLLYVFSLVIGIQYGIRPSREGADRRISHSVPSD